MTIQQRVQILQFLYSERAQGSQTSDRDMLIQRMDTSWDNIRHEVAYLEENRYVEVKRRQIRSRVFEALRITAKGIDLVEREILQKSEEGSLWDANLTNLKYVLADLCIVCALYEEAKAVLEEFSQRCSVSFTTAFSRIDGYEYWHSTILNKRGEPLTVLVTWLVDSGPVRTGLDLKPLLQEFRPRFAAMTGLCGGYKGKVKLGDLVVAQYAYHYEEGKILRGPDGQLKHVSEMKTYEASAQVIQYARGFEAWKEPLAELKRSKLKRQVLRDSEQPQCYIAPMASGMAVRGDNPFPWLAEYRNRKTIALDMEAAAFYLTMRAFPSIQALVVKGVCDYADMGKNDSYHDYAARASAIYLLSFIQQYVTEETMPRKDGGQTRSRAGTLPVSNLPPTRGMRNEI